MYHVSILGLGLIGSRIARHMAGMGDTVTVWNRTPREDFPEAVPTPADAARASKIIQLYLKDRNACLEVFEQMREALTPEHIILNHSTIDLATVGKLSLMSSSIGCTYVDCPFTGSRLPAEKGELVYYVGTDSTTLDRIRPVLEHSSRDILHLGGIGAGTVVKLVTNMVSATMVQSLSEALAISQAYGISPEMLGQAISRNVIASPLAALKLPLMAKRDFSTHFSLDNMRKDSIYAQELAAEKGILPPVAALVSSIMGKLCREGHAEGFQLSGGTIRLTFSADEIQGNMRLSVDGSSSAPCCLGAGTERGWRCFFRGSAATGRRSNIRPGCGFY